MESKLKTIDVKLSFVSIKHFDEFRRMLGKNGTVCDAVYGKEDSYNKDVLNSVMIQQFRNF